MWRIKARVTSERVALLGPEPVTLDDFRAFVRVASFYTQENALLSSCISRARDYIEEQASLSIAYQQRSAIARLSAGTLLEHWTQADVGLTAGVPPTWFSEVSPGVPVTVPRAPIVLVDAVSFWGRDQVTGLPSWIPLSSSSWQLGPGRFAGQTAIYLTEEVTDQLFSLGVPLDDPAGPNVLAALKIDYKSGYQQPANIPPALIQAVLTLAAGFYLYREGSPALLNSMESAMKMVSSRRVPRL